MKTLLELLALVIGLIAIPTSLLALAVKRIELRLAKLKAAAEGAGAASEAEGREPGWRWTGLLMTARFTVFMLGLLYLFLGYFGAEGELREFYFVALILALMVSYQDIR